MIYKKGMESCATVRQFVRYVDLIDTLRARAGWRYRHKAFRFWRENFFVYNNFLRLTPILDTG